MISDPRKWWKYAITCTVDSIHKDRERNTLSSLLTAARDNVVYVEAFMDHLEHPAALAEHLKVAKDYQVQAVSHLFVGAKLLYKRLFLYSPCMS